MPSIEIHSSASSASLQRDMIASLRANRLDPKGLYSTPRQAELWRLVSQRHSPIHAKPEFQRIYEAAFTRVAEERPEPTTIELIGLGSGTGAKEARLCQLLRAAGSEVYFTGIDVSEALVREAAGRLAEAGACPMPSLVCDLAEVKFIAPWLDEHCGLAPRLLSFFGLVPNFTPSRLGAILRALLRPKDVLVASVHLAPSATEEQADLLPAMEGILPQYDNPETLAWLMAGLEAWNLQEWLCPPEIAIGAVEGIPAFLGYARWKEAASFALWGETFFGTPSEPLRLFQSLRYTSSGFERFLQRSFLRGRCLARTSCGEEGIWLIESV